MSTLFSSARPGRMVTYGATTFELPALYFRDDAFMLLFTADSDKVRAIMPSDKLFPVLLTKRKAVVGIVAFNYIETSLGQYGEVGVVLPVVHRDSPPPLVLPALLESRYKNFGNLVMHLPVTHTAARDAGRGEWGYTKFTSDMRFTLTPEYMQCRLSEEGRHILTLKAARKGFAMADNNPLVTYSVKNGDLIKTTLPLKSVSRLAIKPKGSSLQLGDHPVAESIRDLGISEKPFMSRYYLEKNLILPSGEVVERGVRPLEGYYGKDREGKLESVQAVGDESTA
ncbi:MAG: acetoacetate decarboxylase family protein [Desulfobacterales bacterium]|nr:acetoacetate decarboxylase family protein [Desulfobacterales bacterium]